MLNKLHDVKPVHAIIQVQLKNNNNNNNNNNNEVQVYSILIFY